MGRVILLLIVISLPLVSCAPVRKNLGQPVSGKYAEALLSEWQQKASQVDSVQGLANVSVRAPMNDVDGMQVLLAQMPNRLRAETLSPFGVSLMTFAVDDGKLAVQLPAQNLFYQGVANAENLGLFLNLPFEPSELVSLILYQPDLIRAHKTEAFTLTDGGWLLVRHGTLQRQELVFDLDRNLKEVAYFDGNNLIFRVDYTVKSQDKVTFPHRIQLDLPKKYAKISVEFTDFETNKPIKGSLFQLSPPPGADVVYLPN